VIFTCRGYHYRPTTTQRNGEKSPKIRFGIRILNPYQDVASDSRGEEESGVTVLKQTAILVAFFAADQGTLFRKVL
jgi:hypothetical protein